MWDMSTLLPRLHPVRTRDHRQRPPCAVRWNLVVTYRGEPVAPSGEGQPVSTTPTTRQ
jgi:hypothetical protein